MFTNLTQIAQIVFYDSQKAQKRAKLAQWKIENGKWKMENWAGGIKTDARCER